MKGMLTFSPQFVVNPSPEPEVTEPEVTEPEVTEPEVTVTEPEVTEPEVTEPFWSEWFSDEERSDEGLCACGAQVEEKCGGECEMLNPSREEVTQLRGVDCQCAMCLGGSN